MNAKREEEAAFWCSVLGPVLFAGMEAAEERRELRRIAGQPLVFPGGRKATVSFKTLTRKLRQYRRDGFNALARKARSDRGRPRSVPAEVVATAIAAKKDQPRRSDLVINRILR